MRLIETAGQIGPGVGQCESVAAADVLIAETQRIDAVPVLGLDRNEAEVVELARGFEQNTRSVQCLAFGCLHGPRGVAEREVDVGFMRGLVLSPLTDGSREGELAAQPHRRRADSRFELGAQRLAVEGRRLVGLVAVQRLALDDLALAGVDRRELVLRRLQRRDFRFDAEQPGDPVLEVRRNRDQKLRFRESSQRVGRAARGDQARAQRCVGVREMLEKRRVDAAKPGIRVQLGKSETQS